MKPWARIEINYINHPKFLALNANAISLWHEGKNYSDMHHTDGMIPREALKTFRFNGAKGVALLTRSCGLKPNGEPYAPLWEAMDIGGVPHFKMHDYLDHNDCREVVLARLAAADEERERDRERKSVARAAKKTKAAAEMRPADVRELSGYLSGRTSGGNPVKVRSITEAETPTETKEPLQSARGLPRSATSLEPDDVVERAGRLVERYSELYRKHRRGAYLKPRPNLDWVDACDLVKGWSDERLDKLAAVILTTDDSYISGTDRGFKIFAIKASWADDRLTQWEHEHGHQVAG